MADLTVSTKGQDVHGFFVEVDWEWLLQVAEFWGSSSSILRTRRNSTLRGLWWVLRLDGSLDNCPLWIRLQSWFSGLCSWGGIVETQPRGVYYGSKTELCPVFVKGLVDGWFWFDDEWRYLIRWIWRLLTKFNKSDLALTGALGHKVKHVFIPYLKI